MSNKCMQLIFHSVLVEGCSTQKVDVLHSTMFIPFTYMECRMEQTHYSICHVIEKTDNSYVKTLYRDVVNATGVLMHDFLFDCTRKPVW